MFQRVPESAVVMTPKGIATAMVRALTSSSGVWLDPCAGDGAFVREMAALGTPAGRILAIDLSRKIHSLGTVATPIPGRDFIAWASKNQQSVDRIALNPPFVALSRVSGSAATKSASSATDERPKTRPQS